MPACPLSGGALAAGLTLTVIILLAAVSERFLFGAMRAAWIPVGLAAIALLLYPSNIVRGIGFLTAFVVIAVNYVSARKPG